MYNRRGNIFAGSFLQRIKNFLFGCEGVYIKDNNQIMSAAAIGFENDKAKVVLQVNDQMSGCLGAMYNVTDYLRGAVKVNAKYVNRELLYEAFVGFLR